jgi:outer membrane protein OmpA-like peptidoglycan-associated protein
VNLIKKIKILPLAICFLLSSCYYLNNKNIKYNPNLEKLSQKEGELKYKGDFNSFLALEYLDYSRNLLEEGNIIDSKYFAIKGRKVEEGKKIYPELPQNWPVNSEVADKVKDAQIRLNQLLTDNLKQILPMQLAHLIVLNDCFISKETKVTFKFKDKQSCQARFYQLLEEVEAYINKTNPSKINNKTEAETIIVSELEFAKFEIFFDLNNRKINSNADKKLMEIIEYLKVLDGNYKILLIGTTDRSGKEIYNQILASQRAKIVHDYLVDNGVFRELIEMRSLGKDYPAAITKDNIEHPLNRRVIIYILKNSQAQLSEIPLFLIENYFYQQQIRNYKKPVRNTHNGY